MKKKKKRILFLVSLLLLSLGIGMVPSAVNKVLAGTSKSYQDQIDAAKKKKKELEQAQKELEKKIKELKEKQGDMEEYMLALDEKTMSLLPVQNWWAIRDY